jgi:hypothetical protein
MNKVSHCCWHIPKDLEKENARLKRLVADQQLDIQILKEIAKGEF